jgi:hypothetical protein
VYLFKQDRELLCDERVIRNCSKSDYGLLLLKEAQAQRVQNTAVGMTSKMGNVFERVNACITPIRGSKKAFLATLCYVAAFLVLATKGFSPIMKDISETALAGKYSPLEVRVISSGDKRRVESLDPFVRLQSNGIGFDQKRLYDKAISLGFSPNDTIDVFYIYNIRPSWSGYYVNTQNVIFAIKDIQTRTFIPFSTLTPVDAFFEFIYRLL